MYALKNGVNQSIRVILPGSMVLIGLVYLIVFSHAVEGVLNPILLTVGVLLFILPGRKINTGLETPAIFLLLILVLTSILSLDPRRSIYQAWLIGVGILILLYTAQLVHLGIPVGMIWNFLLIIGAGYMLFNWVLAVQWYQSWWVNSGGILIPGISYRLAGGNVTAAYYHGLLMLASARLFSTKKWSQRLLLGLYCLSAILLIFLSSSRGAYLSVIGGYLVLAFIYRRTILKIILPIIRSAVKFWWVSIIGLFLVLFMIGIVGSWYIRNMSSHPTHGPALQSRNEFWGPALKAFIHHPVFGNGPYTFAIFYMQSASVPPSDIFLHAHNTYLDIVSGSGLLGLFGAVWLIGVVVKKVWHLFAYRRTLDSFSLGALMAMGAFAIHSIFDGLYLMPSASFNLCVIVGALVGTTAGEPRKWKVYPIGIALVVAAFSWYNFWLTEPYRRGIAVAENGNLTEAERLLSEAVLRDQNLSLAWQQLGLVRSILASNNNDENTLDSAILAFKNAVRLDPYYSANHANLAALYHRSGQREESIEEWLRAVELAPLSPLYLLNLGVLYEELGRGVEAKEQYLRALDYVPAWAEDVFWQNSHLRLEVLNQWEIEHEPEFLSEQEFTESELLHQPYAEPLLVYASRKISEKDVDTASRMINLAQIAYFQTKEQELEQYWLRAEIGAFKGNWNEAVTFAEKAFEGFRMQGVDGPGSAGFSLYGSGIYRLRMIKPEIVPQMITIKFPGKWQERLLRLAAWYMQANDEKGCIEIMTELNRYNPEFLTQYNSYTIPCGSE